MKKLILGAVVAGLLSGCASEKPLNSYDDAGLCTLKGQALGYGNTDIMPKIQAEFVRRGKLSISQDDCNLYTQTGQQDARVRMGTTNNVINQSQRSQAIDAIRGY
ncbi:hypothetical protein [Pantoea septica]|uniref:hypothetical protein n=1 Tax=Pantoea septica TaxID=472695 RepID=UPI00289C0FA9|nr:hypothetical protein [Pantoea septica]